MSLFAIRRRIPDHASRSRPRTRPRFRTRPRTRALLGVVALTFAAVGAAGVTAPQPAHADGTSSLPTCPFWTNVTPPTRTDTPWVPPLQTAQPVNFSARMAVARRRRRHPDRRQGDHHLQPRSRRPGLPGLAQRPGRRLGLRLGPARSDRGRHRALSERLLHLRGDGRPERIDASLGQMSAPYQLNSAGSVVPWQTPVGSTITMMVTSYNDGGMTASGYNSQLGVCAVDPRVIPWGTYFTVPGYGTCYAADIGTWIQNDTVDVWLPGSQANGWGVQHRTVTIIANPFTASNSRSRTSDAQLSHRRPLPIGAVAAGALMAAGLTLASPTASAAPAPAKAAAAMPRPPPQPRPPRSPPRSTANLRLGQRLPGPVRHHQPVVRPAEHLVAPVHPAGDREDHQHVGRYRHRHRHHAERCRAVLRHHDRGRGVAHHRLRRELLGDLRRPVRLPRQLRPL